MGKLKGYILSFSFLLGAVCLANIEVYDADLFAQKVDPDVYQLDAFPQKTPVNVNVSLFLDHFGPYDETKSEYTLALQVHMSWVDDRLSITTNRSNTSPVQLFEVDRNQLLKIWRPSIYFSNAKMLNPDLLTKESAGQLMGKIASNGKVQIVKRTTMTGSCKGNVRLYPMDVQQCNIEIESTSTAKQLSQQWASQEIVLGEGFSLGNFVWLDSALFSSRVSYQFIGPFTRLEVVFFLRRQIGYFLLNVYLPSVLFVIASWTGFWVDITGAPARVALVLTPMLTHVTSSKAIHDKLPAVSVVNSLDVWNLVCTMFIFAAVVEYATANYFFYKPDRLERKKKKTDQETPPREKRTDRNGEGRFSLPTVDGSPSNASSAGSVWHRVLHWTIPPYKHIEPKAKALDIDRKSRVIFPVSFLLFNIVYWSILLYYSYKARDPFQSN